MARPPTAPASPPAPKEPRLHAYWFWSDLPEETEMRRQLADFRAAGFGTIYIQARLSMPRTLYLSQPYLDAYARAVGHMARLGLRAGLYDDYAWASGHAGGRTVAGADHLRERHLFWTEGAGDTARIHGIRPGLAAALGPAVGAWFYEGGRAAFDDWRVVAAVRWQPDGRVVDATAHVRIVEAGHEGVTLCLDPAAPGARWTAFASARVRTSRMIDYLSPEAGARFVEVGLRPYIGALGDRVPVTLDHVFFDQPAPALYDWAERTGDLGTSLPWSADFEAEIAATKGGLPLRLAALLGDVGPQTGALRSDLYRRHARRMQAAFLGPVRTFCDRHGLALTGHEILPHVGGFDLNGGFAGIDPRVALGTDFFGTDLWRDRTAVDAEGLGAQLSPILGAGVARASGRRGCLAELYVTATRTEARAAGRWEITPADLRAQVLRLHLLGASDVILHALHAGEGNGRGTPLDDLCFDFPPGYNLQPWWPCLREIAEEAATLAGFLDGAAPVEEVAVLYPLETALREGPRHAHARSFGAWCRALVEAGHLPLIVDESGLARVSVRDGRPRLFGSELAALVLPDVTAFADPGTADRIAALERLGLRVRRGPPGAGPGDLPLPADAPVIVARPGLRYRVAGRDAAGWWRVVLFNEGDVARLARITFGAGLVCRDGSGAEAAAARRLRLRVPPGDLVCLRLRGADPVADEAGSGRPTRRRRVAALDRDWTLEIDGATAPVAVTRGWQAEGYPAHSGTGRYRVEFTLAAPAELVLALPGLACMADVALDGVARGRTFRPPLRGAPGACSGGPASPSDRRGEYRGEQVLCRHAPCRGDLARSVGAADRRG